MPSSGLIAVAIKETHRYCVERRILGLLTFLSHIPMMNLNVLIIFILLLIIVKIESNALRNEDIPNLSILMWYANFLKMCIVALSYLILWMIDQNSTVIASLKYPLDLILFEALYHAIISMNLIIYHDRQFSRTLDSGFAKHEMYILKASVVVFSIVKTPSGIDTKIFDNPGGYYFVAGFTIISLGLPVLWTILYARQYLRSLMQEIIQGTVDVPTGI